MHLREPRHLTAAFLLTACAARAPAPPTPAIAAPTASPPAVVPASPSPPSAPEPPPERPLANLQILAHHTETSPLWWSFGEDMRMMPLSAAAAQQLGVTKHIRLTAKFRRHTPWLWLGDTVLLLHGARERVVAVDPTTLAVRWQIDASWSIAATSRMLIVEHGRDTLAGYALATGREVWRGKLEVPVHDLWTDGAQVLVFDSLSSIHAFDADTGTRRWGPLEVGDACGWTADAGVLVVETEAGYRVIDTTSGATLRTLGGPGLCRWTSKHSPHFVRGVVGGGALVVVEPRVTFEGERVAPTVLRSYDLATGAERWTRARDEHELIVAHRDAVYTERDGVWHAVDATSGATRTQLSLPGVWWRYRAGRDISITSGGGATGPLLFLKTDDGEWVLGRGPEPAPLETYVIRGRVLGDPHLDRRWLRDLPIEVGGQVVRTDDAGRFEARGAAVGTLAVSLADGSPLSDHRWDLKRARVLLDGAGTYDVALQPYKQVSGGGGVGRWLPPVGPRRASR